MRDKPLKLMVILVLLLNLLSTIYILHRTELSLHMPTGEAANEGTVLFCFNQPPTLTVPCNTTMQQNRSYYCQLNATDHEGNISYFQIPQPPDNVSIFNISDTGEINFTPSNNDTGNHSTMLGIDDGSSCENAYAYSMFNFTVGNINDPPYLIRPIPNQTFNTETVLQAFFLTDYFADPDGDPLAFSFLQGLAETQVNITLANSSQVTFASNGCGDAYFQFFATDPYNESAESNIVIVTVNCNNSEENQGQDENQNQNGQSGGGGGACLPELVCLPWSRCYPNGMQVEVCRDKNGCAGKDAADIKFYRNCTYEEEPPECIENWLCSDWSVCRIDEQQNRTCTDLNDCGTTRTIPPLQQECVYIPSCFDGVQNGDETGIDCGGSCEACKTIQQPGLIPEDKRFPTIVFLSLIIILSVLIALLVLYRERIYEGLAELGWFFSRQRKKEILLSPSEKQALFEGLALLERDLALGALTPGKAYERLAQAVRTFYSMVFDLAFEYEYKELGAAFDAKELSAEVRELLQGFHSRLELLESGKVPMNELNLLLIASVLEEQRLLVCMLSAYDTREIARALPERHLTEELSFAEEIRLRLLNAHEALQFLFLDQAHDEYKHILRAYDELEERQRTLLFGDIRRLYLEIKYVGETTAR